MIPDSEQITQWTDYLMSIGAAPFTVLACLTFGYVMRLIPPVNNKWIPVACVIIGVIVFPALASQHPDETKAQFIIKRLFMGMFLGLGSWAFHDKLISKIEDKIPLLGKILAKADEKTEAVQSPDKPKP